MIHRLMFGKLRSAAPGAASVDAAGAVVQATEPGIRDRACTAHDCALPGIAGFAFTNAAIGLRGAADATANEAAASPIGSSILTVTARSHSLTAHADPVKQRQQIPILHKSGRRDPMAYPLADMQLPPATRKIDAIGAPIAKPSRITVRKPCALI